MQNKKNLPWVEYWGGGGGGGVGYFLELYNIPNIFLPLRQEKECL